MGVAALLVKDKLYLIEESSAAVFCLLDYALGLSSGLCEILKFFYSFAFDHCFVIVDGKSAVLD